MARTAPVTQEAILTEITMEARRRERRRQTAIGVGLAIAIIGAWGVLHWLALFAIDWAAMPWWAAPAMIVVQTWLFVGLFIVAHDCMHGSLAPGLPWVNRLFGRLTLGLYAAFSYDHLLPEHHKHHRRPGTADDPDFDPEHPSSFLPWLKRFMTHYYSWRSFALMTVAVLTYLLVLQVPYPLILAFYALPAILSALQLFYFGTYRPHRMEEAAPFEDRHNSRTDDFPWLVSLFTCFHFGYHHEHHLTPTVPWWRLPQAHRAYLAARRDDPAMAAR